MLPGLLRLGRHLAGIGSDSRDNLLRQADSDIVAGVTAAEAKALLLAYLEIHNDEISEPEFTDWLDTISTPLERATECDGVKTVSYRIVRGGALPTSDHLNPNRIPHTRPRGISDQLSGERPLVSSGI
jgi:hypothetical protein